MGEGGAALVPMADAEAVYGLIDYASDLNGSPHWLENGKISDINCAFLIDRLERASDWLPRYSCVTLRSDFFEWHPEEVIE